MQLKLYRGIWCAYARIDDGKGGTIPQRTSLRTKDISEAKRRLDDLVAASKRAPQTVGEIVTAYLADIEGRASHTTATYNWKALRAEFEHLRPDQVTREKCREYQAKRLESVGANTVHRELGMLRAALRWQNLATPAVVELPTKPKPKDRHLTRDEFKALLDACEVPHIRLFLILAITTAGRMSAILELKWSKVDFNRGRIYLSNGDDPTNKGRATVPMNNSARAALEEAKEASLSDYVIEWAGGPVKSVKGAIAKTTTRAGLKDVSAHVIRHTAAVWMAESRVPMAEIAQYLGHTSPDITYRVYARYSPEYLSDASQALEVT